ncbi:MAG TPA: hypothetical protein VMZ91_00190 [Candidatus Paceibacterota bacterium]|nr:hypothetical protein [Candidatus Paceibacterota bacterium]
MKKYNWHLCPNCKHYILKNQKPFCRNTYLDGDDTLGSKKVLMCSDFEAKKGSDFNVYAALQKDTLGIRDDLERYLNEEE